MSTGSSKSPKTSASKQSGELHPSKDEVASQMQQHRVANVRIQEVQSKLEKSEWELRSQLQGMTDERDDLLSNYTSAQRKIKTLEADLSAAQVIAYLRSINHIC